jgi:hypothetical protein
VKRRHPQLVRAAARVLAIGGTLILLLTAFRAGWNQQTTDFPNYYTAALLVRQHAPLRNFYDWTWFQKQMTLAGFENQLGAYTAQTPLTMTPMLPIAAYAPQTAKRIWISSSFILLAATIWLLSRTTALSWEHLALLALGGFGSLNTSFLLGQYYLFLLFLLTLSFCWLKRRATGLSGTAAGVAFCLKLYGGPLLAYYAVKREWRGALSFLISSAALAGCAIALFGWADCTYYFTHVLPRSLDGSASDPYDPGNATLSTFFRRLFVREPELNPAPVFNAPWAFFFLYRLTSLTIALLPCVAIFTARNRSHDRDFALFVIAILLLSTSVSSYTYVLLLLPVALLIEGSRAIERAVLVFLYVLLNAPLWHAGHNLTALFPKLWLLLLLFALAGRPYLRHLTRRRWIGTLALVTVASTLDTFSRMTDYRQEPGQRYEHIAVEQSAALSTFPVVLRDEVFYESLDVRQERYLLGRLHNETTEAISFEGQAFYPTATSDGAIRFELVKNRKTMLMQFDPSTRTTNRLDPASFSQLPRTEAISPDGRWVAFTSDTSGHQHIRLRNTLSGKVEELTGGSCNSSYPAWASDSSAIIFASDCGRSFGLTSLYRARIAIE